MFTGFATGEYLPGSTQPSGTGCDFADFLLGLPQQTSLQSGTTAYEFRANSYDLYVQDDWRILANLSLNLGVRYEYQTIQRGEQPHREPGCEFQSRVGDRNPSDSWPAGPDRENFRMLCEAGQK